MIRGRAALLVTLVVVAACGLMRSSGPAGEVRAPRGRIWDHDGSAGAGVSYAIFPTQHIPLRFDHGRHMALGGVTCERCHASAAASDDAADSLVPREQSCTPCHAIDRTNPLHAATPAARCDACHVGFDPRTPTLVARVELPAPNLRFSHRRHRALGVPCARCHGDMREVGLATRLELPAMRQCFTCHAPGRGASGACTTCHLTTGDGTLQTHFAEGWMNPPDWMPGLHHDADFWFTHRTSAADDGARCAVCHRESDCVECHDGRVRDRRVHPNDFTTLHASAARQGAERCTSCHRTSSFCEACHLRAGVAMDAPASARAEGRFHPPPAEWSGRVVGARHHAQEARRSLTACVSCHSERDCITCHAVTGMGGAGVSPHPPGWLNRCGELLRAAPRACASCHDDVGTLQGRCR